jgi:hypothetical protein
MDSVFILVESFISEDTIYCAVFAENVEAIRTHAHVNGLPVNIIYKVKTMITEKNSRKPKEP